MLGMDADGNGAAAGNGHTAVDRDPNAAAASAKGPRGRPAGKRP
jgi:hypothetical protein